MDKIFKILKNKKGVTLIELIVGMVMFAIIALSLSVVLVPTLNMYTSIREVSELNVLASNVANDIINDLNRSEDPAIFDPTDSSKIEIRTSTNAVVYSVDTNGLVKRNTNYLYDAKYYKNKKFAITYTVINPGGITDATITGYNIKIVVMDNVGKELLAKEFVAKPMMLEANQYN